MTSNVGSSVIEKGGGGLGFQLDNSEEDSSYNRIKVCTQQNNVPPTLTSIHIISSSYMLPFLSQRAT